MSLSSCHQDKYLRESLDQTFRTYRKALGQSRQRFPQTFIYGGICKAHVEHNWRDAMLQTGFPLAPPGRSPACRPSEIVFSGSAALAMVATERAAGVVCSSCTALCPASPSFLECTPDPRHLEGGTWVVLLRERGTLGERLKRGEGLRGNERPGNKGNKPRGSSGVKRTSRCHWERASWPLGAKRAWRARA